MPTDLEEKYYVRREAIAAALGIKDAWRYSPNILYSTILKLCEK